MDEVVAMREAARPCEIDPVPDTKVAIQAALAGAEGLVGCPRHAWGDDLIEAAGPSLKWIHATGAGCEEFITPGLVAAPVVLTNGRIIQGPEVADHAVALLLAIARNLHSAIRKPMRPTTRPIELRGKCAVVVGLGGIGLLVAERLHAFGMRVVGVNPALIPMLSFVERVVCPEDWLPAIGEADAVIMAAPLTERTRRIFDASAFSAMKQGAIFINVSRGATVDTDALMAGLAVGRPGSAALDVTDPEPLPANHPLRALDNVVITEHQAGLSDFNRQRSHSLVRQNIGRFAAGHPLLNIVDKALGY